MMPVLIPFRRVYVPDTYRRINGFKISIIKKLFLITLTEIRNIIRILSTDKYM